MARYVDGFVLPVPKKNLAAYRRICSLAGKVWMDHGALQYVECVADDVKPGKLTSFPQSVKLKPNRRRLGKPRAFIARVKITAVDAAGNPRVVIKRFRVRR